MCIYTSLSLSIYIYIYIYACMYKCTHLSLSLYKHIYIYIYVYLHTYTCLFFLPGEPQVSAIEGSKRRRPPGRPDTLKGPLAAVSKPVI